MRIGMIADTYKPHVSGITNYIALNKQYLEAMGHHVYVFTFGDLEYKDNEENIIRSPGLPIIDTGYYLSFRYSSEAKKLLQTMDIAHVHHPFLSGRLALRYCRPTNIPIVFTNHTRYDLYAQAYLPMLPEEISDSLLEVYMPDFCAAVDLVISPSRGMANVLKDLGVKNHIEIVPNGVKMQQLYAAIPEQREMHGFTKEDLILIYTGRMGPEKNLEFLLQAFCGVAEAVPNVHLLMIGGGPEKEKMLKMSQKRSCQNRIHFWGMQPYERITGLLAMSDIFVTASITEVHPLSVIEAMGAGLPVVGLQSVGVGDTVEDGHTGFLASQNPAAMSALITKLCIDHELRIRMGKNAQDSSSKYAIERTTQIMMHHYEQLVYGSRPNRSGIRFQVNRIKNLFRK